MLTFWRRCALTLLLLESPAWAIPLQTGYLGTGAASMGLAGAGAALRSDTESIYFNPAGLAYQSHWQASLSGDLPGAGGNLEGSLAVAGPLLNLGVLGFSYDGLQVAGNPAFQLNQGSVAFGLAADEFISLGIREKFLAAQPGGLAGWSMDLGLQAGLPLPQTWSSSLVLGLALHDAASDLVWQNGAAETQALLIQGGMALGLPGGLKLLAQADHDSDWTTDSPWQWRAGAEEGLFHGDLNLRAGWTQLQGNPAWATAGVGARFPLGGLVCSLDYAWMQNLGDASGAPENRQLLGLTLGFPGHPGAGPDVVLNGRQLALAAPAGTQVRSWSLALLDGDGLPVRRYQGLGALPASLAWDGRDDAGRKAAIAPASYRLDVHTEEGPTWLRQAPLDDVALPQSARQGRLALLDKAGEDETAAPEAALLRTLVDPVTHKLQHAMIGISGGGGGGTRDWDLDIVDGQGRVLRTLHGHGPLPTAIHWDGRDGQGQPVDAGEFSYELRTTSASGAKTARHAALARPAGVLPVSFGDLAAVDGDDGGLRDLGGGNQHGPRVKPSLRGLDHSSVQGADFDLSDVSDGPVSGWELKVVDSKGRVIKTYMGRGTPPKNIRWEGQDENGDPVDAGLGGSYQLRVVEEGGKEVTASHYLVSQDTYQAAVKAPTASKGAGFELTARDGGWFCRLYFARHASSPTRWQAGRLAEVAAIINDQAPVEVRLEGHGRDFAEEAANITISQNRGNTVMKLLFERYSIHPAALSVEALGSRGDGKAPAKAGGWVDLFIHPRR